MTDKPYPTDAELDAVILKHWPAAATATLPLRWIRGAFREGIAKWGSPVVAGEPGAIREAISHFRLMHWADEGGGLGLADALAQLYGDDDIGRASEELDMLADAIAGIATPQPTQAQAGAVDDTALIRKLVEALEHAETTAAYDARGCADLSKCAPAITAGRARLKEIAP